MANWKHVLVCTSLETLEGLMRTNEKRPKKKLLEAETE
jgi:hypothetical protein